MRGAAFAVALAASACTVGPNYKRPLANLPDVYRGAAPAAAPGTGTASLADQRWWELFQDEQLQALIRTALGQNFDARIAERIREEFDEVPGLQITVEEGVRFWALDAETCATVLSALHQAGFLVRAKDGRYRRAPAI